MTAFQILKIASNPRTLIIGISSVLAGFAVAAIHSEVRWELAFFCLLFGIFCQIASNIIHRYYDHKNDYGENRDDHIYDTPTEIPVNIILKEGAVAASVFALTAGFSVFAWTGAWIIIPFAAMVILVMAINMGKFPLSHSPLFLLATFIIFGPIATGVTALAETSDSTGHPVFESWNLVPLLLMSLTCGLLAVNVHITYSAVRSKEDTAENRMTFMTRFGSRMSGIFMAINGLVASASAIVIVLQPTLSWWWTYIPVVTASAVVSLCTAARVSRGSTDRKLITVSQMNMFGFASLSLILFEIIGY